MRESCYTADDDGGMRGAPKVDGNNPVAARRGDPIIGKAVLWHLKHRGADWAGGRLYDPESGRTYHRAARLLPSHRLELRAFIGIDLFRAIGNMDTLIDCKAVHRLPPVHMTASERHARAVEKSAVLSETQRLNNFGSADLRSS